MARVPIHDHIDINSGGKLRSASFSQGGGGGGDTTAPTTDHGALSGLGDDDHTQYLLRSILTTQGDMLVQGTAVAGRLAIGTATTVLTSNGTTASWAAPTGGGGGGSVTFQDEGSAIGTGTILNFVGAGVSAAYSGGTVTATISGGTAAGSIVFLDEGTVAGTATALNVVGSSGTVAYSGGTATLTLSGGSGATAEVSAAARVYAYITFH